MSTKKILIIEPHSDDSAIAAGGYLRKLALENDLFFLLVTASDIYLHHHGDVSRETRVQEYHNYVESLGGTWLESESLPFDADSRLELLGRAKLVTAIEEIIERVHPDTLFLQGSSFHQDHQETYHATLAALRPTARHAPLQTFIMENSTYGHTLPGTESFQPNYYVTLTEHELQLKLDTITNCFPSQIRPDENALSLEGIRAWARYRGLEARTTYAEAFNLARTIVA